MTTPLRAYLAVDPWDFLDEGIDFVLDRISGEIIVDGIQVTALSGPVHTWRPHEHASPRTCLLPAAAYFQPDAPRYAGSRLRPVPAPAIKSRNPLEQIADACRKRNLALRIRIAPCDSPLLIERHGFVASKDVFGDPSPARLCPSNPDVRAFIAALVQDLASNYQPESIDLGDTDFGRPDQFHPGRRTPADPADWHATVLCFCESCRQAAAEHDVPIDDIADLIRANPRAAIKSTHDLQPLLDLREQCVARLIAAACDAAGGPCCLELHGPLPPPTRHRLPRWAPLSGLLVPGPVPSSQDIPLDSRLGDLAREAAPVHIIQRLGFDVDIPAGAAAVVRAVASQAAAGVRTFVFESYGAMPEERFDWIRQAIRFARRDTAR